MQDDMFPGRGGAGGNKVMELSGISRGKGRLLYADELEDDAYLATAPSRDSLSRAGGSRDRFVRTPQAE